MRERIDVGDVEPPGDQVRQRPLRSLRKRGVTEVPDHRDADRPGVESLGMRADHVALHAAVPPLEDLPVAVDEEVVADILPAVAPHVVQLDAANDGRRLLGRVVVRAGCVVDDRHAQSRGVGGRPALDPLVRLPAKPRDDRRRAGERNRAGGHELDRTPDVVGTQAPDARGRAPLDPIRGPGPHRPAQMPAPGQAELGALLVRQRVRVGSLPATPPTRQAPCPEADRAAPQPVQTDHVEPRRSPDRSERTSARDGQFASDDRRSRSPARRVGDGGRDESEQGCGRKSLHQTDLRP